MIGIDVVSLVSELSPEVGVFIISMLPISELRGAIPAGLAWGLPWWHAAAIAVVGNLVPVVFILWFIEPITNLLRRVPVCDRLFKWLFARTRKKFDAKYVRWGDLALLLFVAIPLPVTGAWTGSLAAWLFGIPARRALPFIIGGVILAAGIVTILSVGAFSFFR